MTASRPQTIRERLDASGAPTERDPLFVLVCYCLLSVLSVLAFGVFVAVAAPRIESPAAFVAVFLVGVPASFALPGIVLRRVGIWAGGR
jgi:hypothetical protein